MCSDVREATLSLQNSSAVNCGGYEEWDKLEQSHVSFVRLPTLHPLAIFEQLTKELSFTGNSQQAHTVLACKLSSLVAVVFYISEIPSVPVGSGSRINQLEEHSCRYLVLLNSLHTTLLSLSGLML